MRNLLLAFRFYSNLTQFTPFNLFRFCSYKNLTANSSNLAQ
ncbi:hypothetical protein CAMRE0001_1441 [Campylobacter rectus RM3267]|uniref:Uncharacterized protein n=1 Tax=Campylobacter rectus RM3267 TaxID=553218 RepID=B9D0B7_CAMRE|nr:hypothetical protein CAMRE0001_1441 [Campylobacter rectus RM3267]